MLAFLKPQKDSAVLSNYRPIALTSCLCKLMEKMVNVRLVWVLEQKDLITPAQCGFRRMRSCADILIRLEASICEAFVCKKHHVSVFFDLEKAWRFGISETLHNYEFRGELPFSRIRRNLSIHIARFSASESPRAIYQHSQNSQFR